MTTYAPFEAADYLDSEEVIAEYLSAAAEDANPDVFLVALVCRQGAGHGANRQGVGPRPRKPL
jgi:DNA-binding phage protein